MYGLKRVKVRINRFLLALLFGDKGISYNRNELEYWQSKIFSVVAIGVVLLFTPLAVFGTRHLISIGFTREAWLVAILYLFIVWFIINKRIGVSIRKYFIVTALYIAGIVVLLSIGPKGGGYVSIVFSIVLASCLLNRKQGNLFITLNVLIFIFLSYIYYNNYLYGMPIMAYGSAWAINAVMTQTLCLFLHGLMKRILGGLAHQTQIIEKAKAVSASNEAKHRAMIANISDVIVILDAKGDIKYISPNLEGICGVTVESIYNQSIWKLLHRDEVDLVRENFLKLLSRNEMKRTIETKFMKVDGEIMYIELTASNLLNDPNICGVLINFHDITERKLKEEKIIHLNYHDNLTGLYNRAYFESHRDLLENEENLPLSYVIADINGLKIINSSLGHGEGDRLIINVGRVMASFCKKNYILARTGGDEFKILMPNTNREEVEKLVHNIYGALKKFNRDSHEGIHSNVSIGYSTRYSMKQSMEEVIKTAEDYMYNKKLLDSRSIHSSLISSMRTALHEKSEETEAHAQRLIELSGEIGKIIGLSDQQFDELVLFSTLHDIGKIGISDQILKKPGKLNEEEWIEMKKHSEVGYRIAMSSPELVSIAEYILTHHERWDGKGYPSGLRGEEIPLLSRILSVVDAYDAMTEDRAYRKGLPKEVALEEIRKNAGTQFDPEIADIFLGIMIKSDL